MKSILLAIFIIFTLLVVGCGNSSSDSNTTNPPIEKDILKRVYGISLNKNIEIKNFQNSTLYIPKIIKSDEKFPIVLFAPGWSSKNHIDYKTLLTFIASQGYAVIYSKSPAEYNADDTIDRFLMVLNNTQVSKYLDNTKLGVIGHSSGGGISFKVMDYFSKHGYGENGRFVFAMDAWFAFGMSSDDFKNFPKNTKVVMQQFGSSGSTDPRIPFTIFEKLSILGDENRDYQFYKNLNHGYPMGSSAYSNMQVVLKPLDALMDYVFNKKEDAYQVALGLGYDYPYKKLNILPSSSYEYDCNGVETVINYCSILP